MRVQARATLILTLKAAVEQINQAIAQMDEVTQQNAALVQEAAAGSAAMQEQAEKLSRLVGVFRVALHDQAELVRPKPAQRASEQRGRVVRLAHPKRAARSAGAPQAALAGAAATEWQEF